MFYSATRALLDQHMKDCGDDRVRTAEQFNTTAKAIEKLAKKIDSNQEKMEEKQEKIELKTEERHEENIKKINHLMRIVWMAAGAIIAFTLLSKTDPVKIIDAFKVLGGG